MLLSHVFGLLAIVLITILWVSVQRAWRKTFDEKTRDPDALADRIGCHGPDCSNRCDRPTGGPCSVQEEMS
jgi:hypothetical protein